MKQAIVDGLATDEEKTALSIDKYSIAEWHDTVTIDDTDHGRGSHDKQQRKDASLVSTSPEEMVISPGSLMSCAHARRY
jgi:hypothetical protein